MSTMTLFCLDLLFSGVTRYGAVLVWLGAACAVLPAFAAAPCTQVSIDHDLVQTLREVANKRESLSHNLREDLEWTVTVKTRITRGTKVSAKTGRRVTVAIRDRGTYSVAIGTDGAGSAVSVTNPDYSFDAAVFKSDDKVLNDFSPKTVESDSAALNERVGFYLGLALDPGFCPAPRGFWGLLADPRTEIACAEKIVTNDGRMVVVELRTPDDDGDTRPEVFQGWLRPDKQFALVRSEFVPSAAKQKFITTVDYSERSVDGFAFPSLVTNEFIIEPNIVRVDSYAFSRPLAVTRSTDEFTLAHFGLRDPRSWRNWFSVPLLLIAISVAGVVALLATIFLRTIRNRAAKSYH